MHEAQRKGRKRKNRAYVSIDVHKTLLNLPSNSVRSAKKIFLEKDFGPFSLF